MHLAAETGASSDAELIDQVNVGGTRNLVDAAPSAGVERFVLLLDGRDRQRAR